MIRRFPFLIEIVVFGGMVAFLSLGTYSRNRVWNDDIELAKDCAKKSPRKARVHSNLGFAYLSAGIYDKALEETQKAIEIDSHLAMAYYVRHLALEKTGDLNQAIEMAKRSLEIDPELYMSHLSLGRIYFEKAQYQESIESYQAFLKPFPYFPEVHHFLGIVYAAQKRFDKAVAEFEWEIRVNPYHALAHLNAGQIYWYEFRNREKALYHLRTALLLDPFLPNRTQIQRLVRILEASA